jgi:hypothetical protein
VSKAEILSLLIRDLPNNRSHAYNRPSVVTTAALKEQIQMIFTFVKINNSDFIPFLFSSLYSGSLNTGIVQY